MREHSAHPCQLARQMPAVIPAVATYPSDKIYSHSRRRRNRRHNGKRRQHIGRLDGNASAHIGLRQMQGVCLRARVCVCHMQSEEINTKCIWEGTF